MEQNFFLRSSVIQLIKKFPDFYVTHIFITVFITARHQFLS